MSYLGNLPVFDHKTMEWAIFKTRISQFLLINKIEDNKSAILITHISDESYRLLRNLAYPEDISLLKYEELILLLDAHFKAKTCTFADKAKFYGATRTPGENLGEWAARLRGLAVYCDFGTALETNLRDRFVLGLGSGPSRNKLFEQNPSTLSFSEALKLAEQAECAQEAKVVMIKEEPIYRAKFEGGFRESSRAVHVASNVGGSGGGARNRVAMAANTQDSRCRVCGMKNHDESRCRYKNYKCQKCGEKGHLKKMCGPGARLNNMLSDIEDNSGAGSIADGDCEECQMYNLRKEKVGDMDAVCGSDNFDLYKSPSIKVNIDNVTPHKIAVVGFIREFGLLKIESKSMTESNIAPKYRKDFCLLALKLIQCPDMEFRDLENLLTNGKYKLLSVHLQNFCVCLQNIYANGISALMDCVTSTVEKLMIEQSETNPCLITRSSVLGFYLRRLVLHLDKLTFVQLTYLYKSFCLYYQKGRPGLIVRSMSKEKLDNVESQKDDDGPSIDQHKSHDISTSALEEGQWSRKQAELFTAQQANLLQVNENDALPPKELQKTILDIMKDNPDYSDVHFLNFLNCIRIKEYTGAQDSLYNCFDRVTSASGNDKNKQFRYAALNKAAMHCQFDQQELCMESVREALRLGLGAGDAGGVAAAAAWAGSAQLSAAVPLLARVHRAPRAPAHAAAAAHLLARHRALLPDTPANVFMLVSKGDSINYLHSMTEMTLGSLANTAALWSYYGKTELASVYCQLLLNLNTTGSTRTEAGAGGGGGAHWTEASAAAAAGAGALAALRGDGALAAALLSHLRSARARSLAAAAAATHYVYAGKWTEAEQNIHQLASSDRWESQYLKAEMYFFKGNPTETLECLQDVLSNCQTENDSIHFVSLRIRAMILKAQVKELYSSTVIMDHSGLVLLNDALALAKQFHLHFLAAMAEMHIANIFLNMGCAKKAIKVVRRVLHIILAHGGGYDIARGLLLYVKIRMAIAPSEEELRLQVLQSCCNILETVKKNFESVGAQLRLLETWYLQAQLYNEIGNIPARNQCAWMYRQLEAQNVIDLPKSLLMLF